MNGVWSEEEGWKIKALVILEPTSPLRTRKEIDEAVEIFEEKGIFTERDSRGVEES